MLCKEFIMAEVRPFVVKQGNPPCAALSYARHL